MSKLDYCFSNDYMVLRPDRVGPYELMHLLFSPKIGRNRAVDCFTSTEIHSFRRRFAIFMNLLLQLFLLSIVGPIVAVVGNAIEFALNFASNILHGRMEYPDRKSASYRTITGLIDQRVDLERSITPGDSRYHAALCVMASKVAYENEAFIRDVVTRRWNMEFIQFFNCWNEFESAYTAQAFVFRDRAEGTVVVAFRGTPALDVSRWCADVDPSWYKIPRLGRAHAAYTHALGAQRNVGWPKWVEHVKGKPQRVYAYYSIRDAVKRLLLLLDGGDDKPAAAPAARLLLTGHGSGGAMALLFATVLAYHKEKAVMDRIAGVYTFGQPQVGDAMLAMFAERNLDRPKKRHFRFTYGDDLLPRLPTESSATHFLHFGVRLHFDTFYNLKVMKELPGEGSSSSPAAWVTTRVNSAWELARSVYLGYWKSSYCREGWLLLAMRAVAVALPGLPFHRVHDYVNSITLAAGDLIPKDM
uniref:Fungal lipase-type domain-containing protein n=1 Tax=Leersia perrieri TaxID=77586 RepID=A0A0D9WAK7_9ORYZ